MKSKILSAVLAASMVAATAIPAVAAPGDPIDVSGGSNYAEVELTAEAAMFSVTVPTVLPVAVDASGVVTCADSGVAAITNYSSGPVKVTNLAIAGVNGWATVAEDTDWSVEKVGAKKLFMNINNEKTTGADAITFDATNWPALAAANETDDTDVYPIEYDAKAPAQATALTEAHIADVTFTVAWDALEEEAVEP